jgi:non-ribosomal peptide synthetase-like protein
MTSLDDTCQLPPSIRLLNLGGEACPPALVDRLWSPTLRILNTYGPSETTVTATCKELFPGEVVTIGKPMPGYHALILPVLDETPASWSPLEIAEGVEGELAIGGQCLGKGYVGRPALTQEKFVSHPLASIPGERLYRTGDRVRLDSNLDIVFLGRIDAQVKHRGFRIELGEIEQTVASHPQVQTAAVILSTTTDRLEAYIVAKDDAAIQLKEIRHNLRALPSYMMPEACFFVSAADLPRLPSGKINLRALQEISARKAAENITSDEKKKVSATTRVIEADHDLELLLSTISEVFPQADAVTSTLDLFDDLGCHSLLAATLISRLRKDSPVGSIFKLMGLQDVYIRRTPEKIVASLREKMHGSETSSLIDKKETDSTTSTSKNWPVSPLRHTLCSIAQIPALFLLFWIQGVTFIGPYIAFYALLYVFDIGTAIIGTYFLFVLIPVLRAIIGITGKWLVLGKAKPGEYPLYSTYYYRWWLAGHFVKLLDMVTIADTPMMPAMMRCMGASIGRSCHIGILYVGPAMDLVSIGDDVCFGKDILLSTSWIERGRLILKEVRVDSEAIIGSHSVIEGGSIIGRGAELDPLSMVRENTHIHEGERHGGSPARFKAQVQDLGQARASRPGLMRKLCMTFALAFSSAFILPLLVYGPQIPSMMLFDYLNIPNVDGWGRTSMVIIPAALFFLALTYIELLSFRWLVLGEVTERSYRTTSIYWLRKQIVDRLMDMCLVILQPVYATLYVIPFLRSLGVKVGHRSEVSTARGINFELTEIGAESFVADHVILGNETTRHNVVTLKKTVLKDRAFVGNAALIHQGSVLESNTLVGVLSVSPETPLKDGESCFGSPSILMPARQAAQVNHAEHLLYKPCRSQIALRLFIEGSRIILPRLMVTAGLGYSTLILGRIFDHIGDDFASSVVITALMCPVVYLFLFSLPAFFLVWFFKLVFFGRYKSAQWPLWSTDVWKSEFITSTFESLTGPLFFDFLSGTPYLNFCLSLLGVQIGKRATLLSHDITEFDMVKIGDEAVLNMHAAAQTHLFEDRVMKVGSVDVENNACLKPYSICLPDSRVAANAELGSLSLLMKGEVVPTGESWQGAPIAPAKK